MYQNFIGIDISKETITVGQHNHKQTQEFDNALSGFKQFCHC